MTFEKYNLAPKGQTAVQNPPAQLMLTVPRALLAAEAAARAKKQKLVAELRELQVDVSLVPGIVVITDACNRPTLRFGPP